MRRAPTSPITTGIRAGEHPSRPDPFHSPGDDGGAGRTSVSYPAVPMLRREGLLGGRSVRGMAWLGRAARWPAIRSPAVAAAAVVGLFSHPAFAFDASTSASFSLAAIALIALAVLAVLFLAAHRRLAEAARDSATLAAALAEVAALVEAAPSASFRWRVGDGSETYSSGLLTILRFDGAPRFAALLEQLVPEDTGFLAGATEALRKSGTPFALTLGLRDGPVIDAIGRRARNAAGEPVTDVVWIGDAGRRAQALTDAAGLAEECASLRAALDALPLPIWRRAADLALIDCNAAYAAAVDATPGAAITEAREIGGGVLSAGGRALTLRARAPTRAPSESPHIPANRSTHHSLQPPW